MAKRKPKKTRHNCGPQYIYSEVNGQRVFSDRNHRFLHAVGIAHRHVFLTSKNKKVKKLSKGRKMKKRC